MGGGWEELSWMGFLGKEGFTATVAFQDNLDKKSQCHLQEELPTSWLQQQSKGLPVWEQRGGPWGWI